MAEAEGVNPPSEGENIMEEEKTANINDNLDAGGDTAEDQLQYESYQEAAREFLDQQMELVGDRLAASYTLLKNSLPSQREEQLLDVFPEEINDLSSEMDKQLQHREAADSILGDVDIDVFPKETNDLSSEIDKQLLHREVADTILGESDIEVFPKETNDDGLTAKQPKKKHFLKKMFLRFTRRKKAHVDADEYNDQHTSPDFAELEKTPDPGLPREAPEEEEYPNETKPTKKASKIQMAIRELFSCCRRTKPGENPI